MKWSNGEVPRGSENGNFDVPILLRELAEADLVQFASEDEVPFHELRYLQKSILATGSARQLYERYKDCARNPISRDDYSVLDLDIVPPVDTSAEQALVSFETEDAYIISSAYAQYSVRMLCKKIRVKGQHRSYFMDQIDYLHIRDRADDSNLVEFFLNPDRTLDVKIMLQGWQEDRKPATVLQKIILARTIEDLLDPQDPERLVQYDHGTAEAGEELDTQDYIPEN